MLEEQRYKHQCPDCNGQLFVTHLEIDTSIVITPSGYNDAESTVWNVINLEIGCSTCDFSQSDMIDK